MGFSALAATPVALLEREMELEYIVVRAGFFQSLINWLLAIRPETTRFFMRSPRVARLSSLGLSRSTVPSSLSARGRNTVHFIEETDDVVCGTVPEK